MATLQAAADWGLGEGPAGAGLARDLPAFLRGQRWFAGKAREVAAVRPLDATGAGDLPGTTRLVVVEVTYRQGPPELYFVPLGWADGPEATRLERESPARIISRTGEDGAGGVLFDALAEP